MWGQGEDGPRDAAHRYPDELETVIVYNGSPLRVKLPLNPYGEGNDPETGVKIESPEHARKLATSHYGDEPIPVNPGTMIARARRAMLMGEPLPER